MAWERRRQGWFYFRTQRVGTSFRKHYFGNGPAALLAYQQDHQCKAERAKRAERRRQARVEVQLANELVGRLGETVESLTMTVLEHQEMEKSGW